MPPRVSVLVTLILLALLGAAGSFIVHRLENPPRLALLAPEPAPPDPLLAAPVGGGAEQFTIGGIEQYRETVERPLFSSTRRPPPPPKPAPPAPVVVEEPEPEDERNYTLMGVMLTPEATMALLKDDMGNISRLRIGEKIDDWKLEQVNPDNVVLRQGARVRDLPLLRNQQPQLAVPRQPQAPSRRVQQSNGQQDPRELRRRLLQQHRALRQKMEKDVRNQQPRVVPQASATN